MEIDGLIHREVDNVDYGFEKLGAEESLDILLDISKMVGKPLGIGLALLFGSKDGIDREVPPDMLGTVFQSLTEGLDKKICMPIIKKLTAEKVLCVGRKVHFNSHYQDKLPHLFKVLYAALEVQYGNFFVAIQDLAASKAPTPNMMGLGLKNR